jgi:N-glycosylase/DNA lyase
MKMRSELVLMLLLSGLVIKSIVLSNMLLSEALVVIGIVSYMAFSKYIENKKAKEIEQDYENRLKSLENTLSMMNASSRLLNRGKINNV